MLFLSHQDVAALLDPTEVMQVSEDAVRQAAKGTVRWAEPRLMTVPPGGKDQPARFRFKACALDEAGIVGTRLTSITPLSPESGDVPTRIIVLNDAATGAVVGIVDERWSFAVRTGASAVLALKYLAPPDSSTVGIIGAGQVGRGTAYVVPATLPVKRIVVTDRSPEASERFAQSVRSEQGLEVAVVDSTEAVFSEANVVVLATTAKESFVRESWLRPGCTVASLGGEPELDLDVYTSVDKVVVDDWEAVGHKRDMRELGAKGLFDRSNVHADFVELVSGKRPGRERPDERIVVRSEGLAIMDIALAYQLCQKAAAQGAGKRLA